MPATEHLSAERKTMRTNQMESAPCTQESNARRCYHSLANFSLSISRSLSTPLTRCPIHHETSNITFACCRKRSTTLVVCTPPSRDDNDADELYASPPLPPPAKTNVADDVEATNVDAIESLFDLDGRNSVGTILSILLWIGLRVVIDS
jgi:hypothetical protein